MSGSWSHRRHAARVAAMAAAVVVACYVIGALVLDQVVTHRLTTEADGRIAAQLADADQLNLGTAAGPGPAEHQDEDIDDAPIFLWRVLHSGVAEPLTAGAPHLPRRQWAGGTTGLTVGSTALRVDATRSERGWLVAGQSVAEISRVQSVLVIPELIFGFALALAAFVGALVVGLRASAPLDLVRRRQAEFTADASHELRTPLTVVEAEVELALARQRTPADYEAVLQRIAGEGRRLRRIVEDLLWLARVDDGPVEAVTPGRVDVTSVVRACTSRFQAVAARQDVTLSFEGRPASVHATTEWIDRLAGVLLDNACKFAGQGGQVDVRVFSAGGRVGLQVDDSGPGIPPTEEATIFDRFHRTSSDSTGAGLGLAIADSVVRLTGGTWSIGRSPLGGARMEVWWRRAADRRAPSPGRSEKAGARRVPASTTL